VCRFFNIWVSANYERLVRYASQFTDCPYDLVSHTYIKMVNADFNHISDPQTDSYFKRSIKINGTVGDFNKQYKIREGVVTELRQPDNDFITIEIREKLDEAVRYLDEFDRKIMQLYLQNTNMTLLSQESGISYDTLTASVLRIKRTIKNTIK
tara:strand:+ start:312 stop:770 length:459 start_codon:yes stop_codon:yes gene_type:complete